ncbi:MAG: S41 family peptidase, partial [Lentisphaeria bacterium]
MSERLFQDYFVALDPEKAFFLDKDLASFESYKTSLHTDLIAGNLDFPFKVFELFMTRVRERTDFATKRLDQSFDFEINETLEGDRKKLKWLDSVEQMNDYWRKRAKNALLTYQMLEEALDKKKGDGNLSTKEKNELKERELFPAKSPKERAKRLFEMRLVRYEDFDSEDVLEIYLSTLCKLYDIHSSYMAPKSVEDFNIQMRLSLQGIGATLRIDDHGFIKIEKISTGGPADKSGLLKDGDRILGVAQEDGIFVDVIDMPLDRAVKLIRGPKGTKVTLSVIKGDKGLSSPPEIIEIVRDNVEIKESEAKSKIYELEYDELKPEVRQFVNSENLVEAKQKNRKLKIGVIRVPSFYADFSASNRNINTAKTVTNDVLRLLTDLKKQNIDGLVVDLRNNGGGSLVEAIRLTGLFITQGPVVQVASSGADINVQYDRDRQQQYSGPLLVMVNKFSASASEIFAGAIQDYGRGIIVG